MTDFTSAKLDIQLAQINQLMSFITLDVSDLSSGTKTAATQARKRLAKIKSLTMDARAECLVVQRDITESKRLAKANKNTKAPPPPEPEEEEEEQQTPRPTPKRRAPKKKTK